MSKIKVYMTEGWCTYRWSHTIEIDTEDYDQLKGMTDKEVYEYLNENMFELEMKKKEGEKYSMTLAETLQEDWVRDKETCNEFDLHIEKPKEDK